MLLAAGELTNRSPFGAYTIMRGARSSAYTLTVKSAGTVGIASAGLSTSVPRFGFAAATAGNRPGCGSRRARRSLGDQHTTEEQSSKA